MAKIAFDVKDLTRGALERLVRQLVMATEEEEKELLSQLDQSDPEKESNDLADLREEKRGKPKKVDMDAEPTRKKPE